MRVITAAMAAVGVLSVVATSAPAQAQEDGYDGGWRRSEWREQQWREQRWREHEWHERARQAYAPPPGPNLYGDFRVKRFLVRLAFVIG